MNQADHLLRELRIRPRGIHSFEARLAFIANPSERIRELEERGHVIRHERERLNGKAFGTRYTLVQDAEARQAA